MDDAFEERKKKHEEKWARDEALRFQVEARRNKLLGLWAAAELGLTGEAATAYAGEVVAAELKAGPGGPLEKIRADFAAAKLTYSDAVLHAKAEDFLVQATNEILHKG